MMPRVSFNSSWSQFRQDDIRPRLARWVAVVCFAVGFVVAGIVTGFAQEKDSQSETSRSESFKSESSNSKSPFGINGHYRIGHWTAVRVDDLTDLAIETLDGDGERVVYKESDSSDAESFRYVIPGVEAAPVKLRSGSEVVWKDQFPAYGSPSRGPSAIPVDMKWIVCFGDPLGIDELGANELLRRDALIAVSKANDASRLPDSELGYNGVDLIVINQSGKDVLSKLSPKQSQAVADAIRGGVRCFLTLGESSQELLASAPWLGELLPLDADSLTTSQINPAAIETYTTTQTPLSEFVGASLPKDKGQLLLAGRTTRRISTPLAVNYVVGFGTVTVLAADLDSSVFADWPDRMNLIKRLTGSLLSVNKNEPQVGNRLTAFDDLAGQTRATLDQFPIKRKFGFSLLSLILMLLIAAIGPLDYWLINRVFGRPLLGWLTFPLVAIGIACFLTMQAAPATPSAKFSTTIDESNSLVRCNRVEFLDIDTVNQVGSGFMWSYLYSHPAVRFDVQAKPTESLREATKSVDQLHVAPFGVVDKSFGGIPLAGLDARLPEYVVDVDSSNPEVTSALRGLSLAPRSSKSIAARLRFQPKLKSGVRVKRRSGGSTTLEGELVNPLPVDLLDGMLIYGNWVYILPTRFLAGGRIGSLKELQQKNFRWQLSRQELLEKNAVEREKWDPAEFDSPNRVAEMLMFHQSVGGVNYTGLNHEPLAFLDMTPLLDKDRCVLVGRVRDPWLDIELSSDSSVYGELPGKRHSWVRVILPVD